MTIREMNRLLKQSYGEKRNAVDWRICRFRQILKRLANKIAAPYPNGAAVEIQLVSYFFPDRTLAQRARWAAAILARADALIFRRLRSGFVESFAAAEPFPKSLLSSL
jgi:hypothetical protein